MISYKASEERPELIQAKEFHEVLDRKKQLNSTVYVFRVLFCSLRLVLSLVNNKTKTKVV